ncbi:t-SNARE affecting a late Golgi compartment protein 2 [Thecaphora frezii]
MTSHYPGVPYASSSSSSSVLASPYAASSNRFGPPTGAASSSSVSPFLGQTRSRTLLFLSYRDTAARATSRPSDRSTLYSQQPYTDGDDDPLNSSSLNTSEQQGLLGSGSARSSHDRTHTSIDLAPGARGDDAVSELPPKWIDISDQVDAILTSIRPRMDTLARLHEKHLRPGFTDKSAEEKQIEAITISITQDFRRCSRLVAGLASYTQHLVREAKRGAGNATVRQIALLQNVQTALATRVQDLSSAFRKEQSLYLRRMKGMEVRDRDIGTTRGSGSASAGGVKERNEFRDSELAVREDMELSRSASSAAKGQAQTQDLLMLESSSTTATSAEAEIAQRDREITEIAKSIQELAHLFGDLQTLVIDQGTMLDRIDYNVELMSREMEGAVKELEVATGYQRRTGRRQCILFLLLCIALLVAILIIKPFWRFFNGGGTQSVPAPPPPPSSSTASTLSSSSAAALRDLAGRGHWDFSG